MASLISGAPLSAIYNRFSSDRVSTRQQKDVKYSKERLEYNFSNQTDHSVEVALEWERWRIPFTVEVDLVGTTLHSIRSQLSGAMGFDPPSLEAAANWCFQNKVNYEEALGWINRATDPNLGAVKSFGALSTKAGLLTKLNRQAEADQIMTSALDAASPIEMHQYGRRLLNEKKTKEAMAIFERNFKQNKGAWPTNVGMMRGYSATGNLKKALEHAKNDQVVIGFAYDKEIPVMGPVYILIKYEGRSK